MKQKVANEIAKTLDATEGVAKYDECCKKVLSFKKFLAYILNQSTVEFADYSVDEIADKYIEGEPKYIFTRTKSQMMKKLTALIQKAPL